MKKTSTFSTFLSYLRSNPISRAGTILTTFSFLGMAGTFLMSSLGWMSGPYSGLVTFLVFPGLFVLGLLLVPLGFLLYRKTLKARSQAATGRPLNLVRLLVFLTLINLAVVGTAGYEGIHYMDSVEFCGTLCHTVMEPQYKAYLSSPHARVACVECHIGPGASWFAKSKLSGLRQVYAVLFHTYQKPIPTPVKNLRPARETCEQCHWPDKFEGDKLVVRRHYKEDEAVTPSINILLMKTGGTKLDGKATGIHWHIHSGVKVTYVATDEKRNVIPWVQLTDEKGRKEVFTLEGVDPDSPPKGEMRTMDCIDCHNQPTHVFKEPSQALDEAIADGLLSRELPYIKKVGLQLLKRPWKKETVDREIRAELEAFYRKNTKLTEEKKKLLDPAARVLARIWKRNVFPEMGVTWGTYPSNSTHKGCQRCHDDNHENEEGDAIPMDCDLCHVVLSNGEKDPPLLKELGLDGGD